MAAHEIEKIEKDNIQIPPARNYREVIKLFAHFGLNATVFIASALITII